MNQTWKTIPVSAVAVGDRVRLPTGSELLVSRIEENFLGRGLCAFIEDTPERWLKQPLPADMEVEVEVDTP